MKRNIIFMVIISLLCLVANGQVAYYDAISLSEKLNNKGIINNKVVIKNNPSQLKILAHYCNSENPKIIYNMFKNNPFVFIDTTGFEEQSKGNVGFSEKISLGTLSGLDVSTISQGLSKFMIERAKTELNVAFFDRFKEFSENNDEINLLFPITTERLSYLLSYHYSEMINQLRDAFYEDLNNLPDNIIDYLEKGKDFEDLRNTNAEFIIAINSLKLIRQVEYLAAPDFIDKLPTLTDGTLSKVNTKADSTSIKNFKTTLTLASIYSSSVRDSSKSRNWISSKDFSNNIITKDINRQIFSGLLFQIIKNESLYLNDILLCDRIVNEKDQIEWFENRIDEFVYLSNKVDFYFNEINQKEDNGKIENQQVYNYINTTLEIADFGYEIVKKYGKRDSSESLKNKIELFQKANNVYKYVYSEEYSSAIFSTCELVKETMAYYKPSKKTIDSRFEIKYKESDSINIDKMRIKDIVVLKSDSLDYERCKIAFDRIKKNLKEKIKKGNPKVDIGVIQGVLEEEYALVIQEDKNKKLNEFIKYSLFITNIVSAETPEEVSNAIESAALPAGSSAIKRNSNFNIGINAYLGASFINYVPSNIKSDFNVWEIPVGISAPIGITASWGLKGKGGAFSISGILIDIGAIVDYQLKNDSTTIESKITLGNLFSPGVFAFYDVGWNIPISVGGGFQYGPGLVSVKDSESLIINAPKLRYSILLTVDLPLFNLYNKPRKRN